VTADIQKDTVKNCTFLGKEVGRVCLCSILSIGINRFRKALAMIPDQRLGRDKSGQRKASFSVDAFMSVLYEGIAETLPDRFVRRGRAAGKDDEDFDVEGAELEDLRDWLDQPGTGVTWQTVLQPHAKKLVKYLPPGTIADLYDHYQSTRHLFGSAAVSQPGCNQHSVAYHV